MDKVLSILQKNYQDVVKRTAVYDKQFNVPVGTLSLSLTITIIIFMTWFFYSSCCSRSSSSAGSRKKPTINNPQNVKTNESTANGNPVLRTESKKVLSKEAKNTIIIMGPTDSGKTSLLHQVGVVCSGVCFSAENIYTLSIVCDLFESMIRFIPYLL